MKAVLLMTLAVLAAFGALSLYLFFRGGSEVLPPTEAVGPVGRDADLLELLGPPVGARASRGNRVELLENGDEIFPAMLRAIDDATETITLLTYVYWEGDIAAEFVDALVRAGERGVEVRLLIDAFGGARMPDELIDRLEASDVRLEWFCPLDWHRLGRWTNRTHRKVMVVDGRIAFTGGVGIADEWTGGGRAEGEWRDDHFRVTGPVVAALQGAFTENWVHATGEVLVAERLFPPLAPTGSADILSINSAPEGHDSPLGLAYWSLIHLAEDRLDLSTPYFVPNPSLLDEIVRAAERGVRVRLLLPGEHNDSNLVRVASLALYPQLLDAGVELYEYEPTMMHTKALVADGRYSIVGSANLDNRSFALNHESVLVVDDPRLAGQLHESFARDLQSARRVDPDSFDGVGSVKAWVASTGLALRAQL